MNRADQFRGVGRRTFDEQPYFNCEEIASALRTLYHRNNTICERFYLRDKTAGGNLVHALMIRKLQIFTRPTLLLLGGIHAREWTTPDAVLAFAADFIEAYTTGSDVSYGDHVYKHATLEKIMDKINIVVVPACNPDGRNYSQSKPLGDPNWRQNFRGYVCRVGDSEARAIGVDINRNFPFLWDTDPPKYFKGERNAGALGYTNDPLDKETYRGERPASEIETANIIHLLDTIPGIQWMVDVHSAVRWVMYPWSHDDLQTSRPDMSFLDTQNEVFNSQRGRSTVDPDYFDPVSDYREYMPCQDVNVFTDLADAMAQGAQLNSQQLPYRCSPSARADYHENNAPPLIVGSSDDYAYSRHLLCPPAGGKIFSFTFEMGGEKNFRPPLKDRTRLIREACSAFFSLAIRIAEKHVPKEAEI